MYLGTGAIYKFADFPACPRSTLVDRRRQVPPRAGVPIRLRACRHETECLRAPERTGALLHTLLHPVGSRRRTSHEFSVPLPRPQLSRSPRREISLFSLGLARVARRSTSGRRILTRGGRLMRQLRRTRNGEVTLTPAPRTPLRRPVSLTGTRQVCAHERPRCHHHLPERLMDLAGIRSDRRNSAAAAGYSAVQSGKCRFFRRRSRRPQV